MLFIIIDSSAQDTIQHVFNFEQDITIGSEVFQGEEYQTITYPGASYHSQTGAPRLPVLYFSVIVPSSITNYEISYSSTSSTVILDNLKPIMPSQEAYAPSENATGPILTSINNTIYSNNGFYPNTNERVKISGNGFLDGNIHILTISIVPVLYNPVTHTLEVVSSVTVFLTPSVIQDSNFKGMRKVASPSQEVFNNALINGLVKNPNDKTIFKDGIYSADLTSATQLPGFPFCEYLVVTKDEFIPEFEELLFWKRRKGLKTGIISIEKILTDFANVMPTTPDINDNAGILREYLRYMKEGGLTYVLLGGDDHIIPIRMGTGSDNSIYASGGEPINSNKIPSDLYFADFNGNWNVDNDLLYGEPSNDRVDYLPELFVGRLLVREVTHIKNYTFKMLKYEQLPGNGNFAYLTKGYFYQADEMAMPNYNWQGGGNASSYVVPHIPFITSKVESELPSGDDTNPNWPLGSDIVNKINTNYGLVSLACHGGPDCVTVSAYRFNTPNPNTQFKEKLNSYDHYFRDWSDPLRVGNGWDNLTNLNYPNVQYSIACETMPFDAWRKHDTTITFGGAYTTQFKTGGVAYLGNTRVGWQQYADILFGEFGKNITNGNWKFGVGEGISKSTFFHHFSKLTHNLLGCPETDMWTAIPQYLAPSTSVVKSGNSLTVNTSGINSTICIMSALDNGYTYHEVVKNTSNFTFNGVPNDYYFTVTAHNYIPYFNVPTFYLQNESFTTNAYIKGDFIFGGYNVTTSKSNGVVGVNNGVTFVLEAQQEIILIPGFTIEAGAHFEMKKTQ